MRKVWCLLTPMPNCFIEETYQNLWKRIWAVAKATCFLSQRKLLERCMCPLGGRDILSEENTGFVDELASVRTEVLFQVGGNPIFARRRLQHLLIRG
jgi:hypothetical protein